MKKDYYGILNSELDRFWVSDLPDFFSTGTERHEDLSIEITLSAEEARKGCQIPIDLPLWVDCSRCRGLGGVEG